MFTDIYRVVVSSVKIRLSGSRDFHAEVSDFILVLSTFVGLRGRPV